MTAKPMTRRAFAAGALAALAAPSTVAVAAAAPAGGGAAEPLWFVDPELRPEARRIQASMGAGSELTIENLPQLRGSFAAKAAPWRSDVPVATEAIRVGAGHPDAPVYVVDARPGASRPAILFLHGGGFVAGSARAAVPALQDMARRLDCVAVAVEYRLAPETTYRGSVADNYAALHWLHDHAASFGVDPGRVVLMGESAGGGHAALLAIAARGRLPVAFQLLVYPMLDDRTGSVRQPPLPIGTLGWTAQANRFGWRSFLGEDPGGSQVPSAAVPARLADMAGLPPAFVGVGSIDLLFEESVVYASRLIQAGIAAELVIAPGAFHGFDALVPGSAAARRFEAARSNALRGAFAARP